MSDKTPSWLGSALAFARSIEPSQPLPRRAVRTDLMFAGLALVAALIAVAVTYGIHDINVLAALATAAPLAIRRRFPLTAFVVLVAAVIAAKDYVTEVSFLAVVIAGYSAAVYSRLRGLTLLIVAAAGAVLADVFWKVQSGTFSPHPGRLGKLPIRLVYPKLGFPIPQPASSWRIEGFLVLIALVAIAIVGGSVHAGNRIRRLQAEHEAATRRALETERARIARELHDVVTHNVSVMIVQAGAARQVLDASPADATQALLAVESSGRSAMSELRHLLGLLSPGDGSTEPDEDLRPQPGLGQLRALIDRTAEAGLPVDLQARELPGLAPGADLAAYRVVQEALTNVLKHAGKPVTTVRVGHTGGAVVVEVVDEGPPIPGAAPGTEAGVGRGLAGLRERVGVYGGQVEAGPVAGGGWRVWARIPVEDAGPVARSNGESGRRGVVTQENRYPAAAAPG